jgi:hypothetical protein
LRRLCLAIPVCLSEGVATFLVLFRVEFGSVWDIFSIVFLRVTFRVLGSQAVTDLVNLRIDDIPILGFFPPDAKITALSALTRLKVLHFDLSTMDRISVCFNLIGKADTYLCRHVVFFLLSPR